MYISFVHSTSRRRTVNMFRCDRCGEDFARIDSLSRHRNRRYRCRPEGSDTPANEEKKLKFEANQEKRYAVKTSDKDLDDDIPEFDGAEFCDDKPLKRETLYKMMKMLKIPEHRWERIASKELEYRRNTAIHQ